MHIVILARKKEPHCHGGAEGGYCDGTPNNYQGARAVIGALYGAAGVISGAKVDNVLVSGPYLRAFSIASAWSPSGNNPVGSLNNWSIGAQKNVTFEMPQKVGIRSKIWATGSGFDKKTGNKNHGTVYDLSFPRVFIGKTQVTETNYGEFFNVADKCSPESRWGGWGENVGTITFGNAGTFNV